MTEMFPLQFQWLATRMKVTTEGGLLTMCCFCAFCLAPCMSTMCLGPAAMQMGLGAQGHLFMPQPSCLSEMPEGRGEEREANSGSHPKWSLIKAEYRLKPSHVTKCSNKTDIQTGETHEGMSRTLLLPASLLHNPKHL